jgi:hypothetical protein
MFCPYSQIARKETASLAIEPYTLSAFFQSIYIPVGAKCQYFLELPKIFDLLAKHVKFTGRSEKLF